MTVADRIRQRREQLNMSQEELALKIGNKDKSTISKIEKAGDNISMKNIKRIADALGVSSQFLLGWEEMSKDIRMEILHNEFEYAQAKCDKNKELMDELEEKREYLAEKYRKQYDIYLATKYDTAGIIVECKDEVTDKALQLYHLYENAEPHIKAAVESLLKGPQ